MFHFPVIELGSTDFNRWIDGPNQFDCGIDMRWIHFPAEDESGDARLGDLVSVQ